MTASAADMMLKANRHKAKVSAPGLLAEDAQGNQLHEGVHTDDKVGLVMLEGLADLFGYKERGNGLRGHMDEPWLLTIIADAPHQAVAHHE